MITLACHGCGTMTDAHSRLPRGWKRAGDLVVCATCLGQRYVQRALTIPIASPVDATWAEFGAALRAAWSETTRAANWIVTALYARDVRRRPADVKLAPMPVCYLYPEARDQFPQISPIHLTALLRQVERTYRQQRYELLWTGTRSLAAHRYPVPTPLHTQGYAIEAPDPGNGTFTVRVRLGERWWRLRLRAGRAFAIHLDRLTALRAGTAIRGAGALLGIRSHVGDHRHQETERRVLLKLTGYFPRPTRSATALATVTTAASDLAILRLAHQEARILHGDELRRVIRAYETRRSRRARIDVTKQAQRVQSLGQQYAAWLVRWAIEGGAGTLVYEDEERGFCDPFPWTRFRLWLQSAAEGRGLTWQYASGVTETASAEPARDPVKEALPS